jgi:hypothetical protein
MKQGSDHAIDTSSNPGARLNAIRSTKVWGTMCFVGEGSDVHIDVSPHHGLQLGQWPAHIGVGHVSTPH